MAEKNTFDRDQQLPIINRVQPHDTNVMPDGILEAISPTDLALMAVLKDAPRVPVEEDNQELVNQNVENQQLENLELVDLEDQNENR